MIKKGPIDVRQPSTFYQRIAIWWKGEKGKKVLPPKPPAIDPEKEVKRRNGLKIEEKKPFEDVFREIERKQKSERSIKERTLFFYHQSDQLHSFYGNVIHEEGQPLDQQLFLDRLYIGLTLLDPQLETQFQENKLKNLSLPQAYALARFSQEQGRTTGLQFYVTVLQQFNFFGERQGDLTSISISSELELFFLNLQLAIIDMNRARIEKLEKDIKEDEEAKISSEEKRIQHRISEKAGTEQQREEEINKILEEIKLYSLLIDLPELKSVYSSVTRVIPERVSYFEFSRRVLEGISQFAMADKKDGRIKGRLSILGEIKERGEKARLSYFTSFYRWGRLRDLILDAKKGDFLVLLDEAQIALTVLLANYHLGDRSEALSRFDNPKNLDNFSRGWEMLIGEPRIDLVQFANPELDKRAKDSSYPSPLQTLIEAGKYANIIKKSAQEKDADELAKILANYIDPKNFGYYSLPPSLTKERKREIIKNTLVEAGPSIVAILLSTNKRIEEIKNLVKETIVEIAKTNPEKVIPIVVDSLVKVHQGKGDLFESLEAIILDQLPESTYYLLKTYAEIRPPWAESKFAPLRKIIAPRTKWGLIEDLEIYLLVSFNNPDTHPYFISFLKEASQEGKLNLGSNIIGSLFLSYTRETSAADDYELSLPENPTAMQRFAVHALRLYKDNINRPFFDKNQKKLLLLASQLSLLKDLIPQAKQKAVGKSILGLVSSALRTHWNISSLKYLTGFYYATILQAKIAEGSHQVDYNDLLGNLYTEINTIFEKKGKRFIHPLDFAEMILYGMVMQNKKVKGQVAKAKRVVDTLKNDEEVWDKFLGRISNPSDKNLETNLLALDILLTGAKNLAEGKFKGTSKSNNGKIIELVPYSPFDPEILESVLQIIREDIFTGNL